MKQLQFENEHVSVWKMVVSPDQPLQNTNEGVLIALDTHQACWHNELKQQKEPVEMLFVEMKQPKDRPLPSRPID